MDLLQLSHLNNPNLSQHVQMGGQQHQAHEAFAASAARPYGFGGMGLSSGVAGSGLLASAQGQDESAGRHRGGSTSGSGTLAPDLLPHARMLSMMPSLMFPESYMCAPVGQAPFNPESVQSVPSSQAGTVRFR
jgi:hypothetical protein